jgi:hypothetical protein
MPGLRDFYSATLGGLVGNIALAAGGLAVNTGGATTYKTANTITYLADGVFATKTTATAQAIVANNAQGYTAAQMTVGTNKTAYFLVAIKNSDASVKNFAGLTLNPDGTLTWSGKLPQLPEGYVPVGYIKIVTTSGTFTPGTTALDSSTGMTITYKDLGLLPMTESP